MLTPKPSQIKFTQQIFKNGVYEGLYAGTAGIGKTFWVANLVLMLCNDYPGTRWGVFRKELSTARSTVWHTYIKALEILGLNYRAIRGQQLAIYLVDTDSSIEFFGLDRSKDPDYMKTKGLELSGAHIDESNEVEVDAKNIVKSRIGRWNTNGVPAKMVYTCNPSQGWVRDEFKDLADKGSLPADRIFVEGSAEELEDAYRSILESLPEKQRARYLENNWNYTDDPDQLIKFEWIKNNYCLEEKKANEFGADMSRNKDKSILAYLQRGEVSKLSYLENIMVSPNQTIATADKIKNRMNEYNVGAEKTAIDVVGIGAGAADYLKAQGYRLYEYNGGSSAEEKKTKINTGNGFVTINTALQFKNRRAQDYWNVREGLRTGKLKIIQDEELVKELISIKYKETDKLIQIESKQEIKKRLGHSPDKADALVMAYATKKVSNFGYAI